MRSSNRKPVSLNDSHYRLLQDLSAPPKPFQQKEGDDAADGVDEIKIQERRRLSKPSSDASCVVNNDTIPTFSTITDFDSPPGVIEEEKAGKVRIEGRRRLCKVSCRDKENADITASVSELSFSHIADFGSQQVSKPSAGGGSNYGGDSIRDILNDLTSRLDLLSIEKKKVPGKFDATRVDKALKVDVPEYGSAESSFSGASEAVGDDYGEPNLSGGSVGDHNADKEQHGIQVSNSDYQIKDMWSEVEGDNYDDEVHKPNQINQRELNHKSKREQEILRTVGRSSVRYLVDDHDEDENDCVVWSRRNMAKEQGRQSDKCIQSSDNPAVINLSDEDVNDELSNGGSSFTLSGPTSTYNLSHEIGKMLYPHQREGLRWLWSLHCQGKGGILGDDMGLGKTMQICGFLAGLFHSKLVKRALVVAPKTLLSHWIKELSVVGLSSMTREYFGTSTKARQYELHYILQDKGILLTTYDIVRNNSKSLQANYSDDNDSEDGCTWDYMILDEGHLIKNPSTQRAKSLLEIPSTHRIVISGTPIQNNLKELWALFNFCCPDLLGDKKWFKEKYEDKILRGNDKNATDREKRIGSTVAKELRERIQPYFLRRLKNEVFKEDDNGTAQLSKKNELIVWLRLTTCQRQLYEAFLQSELVLSAFDGSPLAALTILKKICDHPLILTKRAAEDVLEGMENMLNPNDADVAEELAMHVADVAEITKFQENHDKLSCKISFILSLLDDLIPKGHHVLIFSQTRKMLNCIQESLTANGYDYLRIDGTTKASDRVRIVNEFQEGNSAPIFLLTSLVGGLGLTLTKADRVIVVDPAWNPSTDNQSVDRAYRIGQKKDVIVYRLMTCGTVEEKIYRKQIFKGGLFKSATEHKEQIRYFSQQDLRELFSLPMQGFDVSLTQKQLHEEHDNQYTMDEYLESHIKFLETQGIAGVSHHSLLFSKTAPVQVVTEEDERDTRKSSTMHYRKSSSRTPECEVDGAMYAFNPKDVKLNRQSSLHSDAKLTESEIKARTNRLQQLLANKATVSKLPDQGAKLQKQILALNAELSNIAKVKKPERQVIDLDDLSGDFGRVLNV